MHGLICSFFAIATLAVASIVNAETNTQKVQFLVDAPEGLNLLLVFYGPPVDGNLTEPMLVAEVPAITPVAAGGLTVRYAFEAAIGQIPDGTAYVCLLPKMGDSVGAALGCVSNIAEPGASLPLDTNYSFAGLTIPQEAFTKN